MLCYFDVECARGGVKGKEGKKKEQRTLFLGHLVTWPVSSEQTAFA